MNKSNRYLRPLLYGIFLLAAAFSSYADERQSDAPLLNETIAVVNLSHMNFAPQYKQVHTLREPWEFYWDRLLFPESFPVAEGAVWVSASDNWQKYDILGKDLSPFGKATYRIRILFNDNEAKAIMLPRVYSSYELYINGVLMGASGSIGNDRKTAKSIVRPKVITMYPAAQAAELILRVSNYDSNWGGIFGDVMIGSPQVLHRMLYRRLVHSVVIITMLLVIGAYHLFFFLYRRRQRASLYFFILCSLVAAREMVSNSYPILYLFSNLTRTYVFKANLVLLYCFLIVLVVFLNELFRGLYKSLIPVVKWQVIATCLLIIVIPTWILSSFTQVFPAMALITLAYILYCMIYSMKHGIKNALSIVIGIVIVILSGLNDALHHAGIIHTTYTATYGVAIFGIIQALAVSRDFARAYVGLNRAKNREFKIRSAYQRFVPYDFLKLLGKNDILTVKSGDFQLKELSIMFANIRGYTALSEKMTPQQNFIFINEFLEEMSPIIVRYNGIIDKFIGDIIMALFVFPIDAVRAARDMVWKLNEYNGSKHKRTHIGVGIHTGVSILGIVGDDDRANVTVLSDAVNLAARIESLTKKYGTPILISGNTASDERIHNHFSPQYLGDVKVKGKNRVTSIYSVMTADLASA